VRQWQQQDVGGLDQDHDQKQDQEKGQEQGQEQE
jgi:hypothetical protein